jgi:hypothetical protein
MSVGLIGLVGSNRNGINRWEQTIIIRNHLEIRERERKLSIIYRYKNKKIKSRKRLVHSRVLVR